MKRKIGGCTQGTTGLPGEDGIGTQKRGTARKTYVVGQLRRGADMGPSGVPRCERRAVYGVDTLTSAQGSTRP